ncbi:MAG: Kdo hydroxylase family protein [Gammaproteobacteria bacterium]|nr:Kdo hydroxylase family protein [Gammaproteobacteria bacterium]
MEPLRNIDVAAWESGLPADQVRQAVDGLEAGCVLFFPRLTFALRAEEERFLDPASSDGHAKNVSFDPVRQELKGTALAGAERARLQAMVARFSVQAHALVTHVLADYAPYLRFGRTSYRPVEVQGRPGSYRKDDSRLHVDAFPARPNRGERILRVFANVNPHGRSRLWRLGEPFEDCARRFLPRLSGPWPGSRRFMQYMGITRGYRALYDHYMLALHDAMKKDTAYQRLCPQTEVAFPSGSAWAAFTDQVSHAALSGQFLFEQTFHLPVHGLRTPDSAPLRVLERLMCRRLA